MSVTTQSDSGSRTGHDLGVSFSEDEFGILSTVLGHPQKMPCFEELLYMNPSLSPIGVLESVNSLVSDGVLARVRVDGGVNVGGIQVCFRITERGWGRIESVGVSAYVDRWETVYHLTLKPESILVLEEMDRPGVESVCGV